jgi:hypothetical protein
MIAFFIRDLIVGVESLFLTSSVKIFEQQKRTHYAFLTRHHPLGGADMPKRYMGPAGGSHASKKHACFQLPTPAKTRALTTLLGKKIRRIFYGLCNHAV